jgi:hypothetical protein
MNHEQFNTMRSIIETICLDGHNVSHNLLWSDSTLTDAVQILFFLLYCHTELYFAPSVGKKTFWSNTIHDATKTWILLEQELKHKFEWSFTVFTDNINIETLTRNSMEWTSTSTAIMLHTLFNFQMIHSVFNSYNNIPLYSLPMTPLERTGIHFLLDIRHQPRSKDIMNKFLTERMAITLKYCKIHSCFNAIQYNIKSTPAPFHYRILDINEHDQKSNQSNISNQIHIWTDMDADDDGQHPSEILGDGDWTSDNEWLPDTAGSARAQGLL